MPTLHLPSTARGSGTGPRGQSGATGQPEVGHLLSAPTDDQGAFGDAQRERQTVDPEILRHARAIAARLAFARPARRRPAPAVTGEAWIRRYRAGSDELDLDRTLEVLVDHPHPRSDELLVRERERSRRRVALLVDVSGSMRGERIRTAAATVGALAAELANDAFAVIAFWSDAALIKGFADHRTPDELIADVLAIPAQGLTNLAFPLEVARDQLGSDVGRERRVVLLSDCVHNAGPDPRELAWSLERVDVLFDNSGESDVEMAHDLARHGRGILRRVQSHRDVAGAITAFFTS